jgi:hypothetical protein
MVIPLKCNCDTFLLSLVFCYVARQLFLFSLFQNILGFIFSSFIFNYVSSCFILSSSQISHTHRFSFPFVYPYVERSMNHLKVVLLFRHFTLYLVYFIECTNRI